jgi:hypothetical protein
MLLVASGNAFPVAPQGLQVVAARLEVLDVGQAAQLLRLGGIEHLALFRLLEQSKQLVPVARLPVGFQRERQQTRRRAARSTLQPFHDRQGPGRVPLGQQELRPGEVPQEPLLGGSGLRFLQVGVPAFGQAQPMGAVGR